MDEDWSKEFDEASGSNRFYYYYYYYYYLLSIGKFYFFNRISGLSSWEEPSLNSSTESKWIKVFDENEGKDYYYNSETGETTWDEPILVFIIICSTENPPLQIKSMRKLFWLP